MAATAANLKTDHRGHTYAAWYDLTPPNSYATGGFALPLTPSGMGFGGRVLEVGVGGTSGYVFVYNYVTNLLQAFVRTTGVEVAADTNLSALTVRLTLEGTSAF